MRYIQFIRSDTKAHLIKLSIHRDSGSFDFEYLDEFIEAVKEGDLVVSHYSDQSMTRQHWSYNE